MKKFMLGLLVGLLFATASSVYAADISKVGKKITTEFIVKLNGEELPVKAVAFEGISYAPVRVISEALGLDVGFKDNEVILNSKAEVEDVIVDDVMVGDGMKAVKVLSKYEYGLFLDSYLSKIEGYEALIMVTEYSISNNPEEDTSELKAKLEEHKVKLAEARQAIIDLKAKYPEYAD